MNDCTCEECKKEREKIEALSPCEICGRKDWTMWITPVGRLCYYCNRIMEKSYKKEENK